VVATKLCVRNRPSGGQMESWKKVGSCVESKGRGRRNEWIEEDDEEKRSIRRDCWIRLLRRPRSQDESPGSCD
jgi:hypothetical protein